MEGRSVAVLPAMISDGVAGGEKSKGTHHGNALECHMCWMPPTDPVATSCGHVFCWPCVFSLVENKQKRKPCPMCGTFLTRDMHILPLYCGSRSVETSEVARASLKGKVVPPRPSHPRMFMPQFARVKDSNKDRSNFDTSISMSALGEIEQEIKQEISKERARNERMSAQLTREEDQVINGNASMKLAKMEWKLMQDKSQMALDIARLEGQVSQAAQLLPTYGCSDLTFVDFIGKEMSLCGASFRTNHSL